MPAFNKMNSESITYSELPLGKLLSGIGRSIFSQLNCRLNHLDIKRYFFALSLIGEGNGVITPQDLAVLLNSDKVTVVRVTDYLKEQGYIKKMKDPIDKRKYRLSLTEKAATELPLIRKTITEVNQNALKGLSKEKIEAFFETLNIIRNNVNLMNPNI